MKKNLDPVTRKVMEWKEQDENMKYRMVQPSRLWSRLHKENPPEVKVEMSDDVGHRCTSCYTEECPYCGGCHENRCIKYMEC